MGQNKKQALFIDAVILESCNLACEYCRPERALDKDEVRYIRRLVESSKRVGNIVDYDIYKISGYGEITLAYDLDQIAELLEDHRLLVITNGTRLTNRLFTVLSNHPDSALCVSLDGHLARMNVHRRLSDKGAEKAIRGILTAGSMGIPTEINTVISRQNIGGFWAFLGYLAELGTKAMVFPFPVRKFPGVTSGDFMPTPEQLQQFEERLSCHYAQFYHLLPPFPYMSALVDFMRKGSRTTACTQPGFVVGVDKSMNILGCPCGPQDVIGNVGDEGMALERLLANRLGRWPECTGCFNHYEAINLYIQGKIDEREIARIPSIGTDRIIAHLRSIKAEYEPK
jgi:MoaA/NifB/PqqE/SkfB family radical SAM enzyme